MGFCVYSGGCIRSCDHLFFDQYLFARVTLNIKVR